VYGTTQHAGTNLLDGGTILMDMREIQDEIDISQNLETILADAYKFR